MGQCLSKGPDGGEINAAHSLFGSNSGMSHAVVELVIYFLLPDHWADSPDDLLPVPLPWACLLHAPTQPDHPIDAGVVRHPSTRSGLPAAHSSKSVSSWTSAQVQVLLRSQSSISEATKACLSVSTACRRETRTWCHVSQHRRPPLTHQHAPALQHYPTLLHHP